MDRIRNKKTVWDDKPRSGRKLACIRLKNKIQSHAKHLGGRFTTHDVIDASPWADIYFLSRAHLHRIYNATVDSAIYAYFEKCDSLAWEASEKILPTAFEDCGDPFTPMENGLYALASPSEARISSERRAFGGLTRYEWIDQEKLRLADSGDVWVSPGARLDFSYQYGVGLMAILPCESLSVSIVDDFVEGFLNGGELAAEDRSTKLSFPASRSRDISAMTEVGVPPSEWAPSVELRQQAKIEREALEEEAAPAARPASRSNPRSL